MERLPEESLRHGRQHAKGGVATPGGQRNGQEAMVSGQMDVRDTAWRPLVWVEVPGVDPRGWALSWLWPACLNYPGPVQLCRVGAVWGPATSSPQGSRGAVALMTGKCLVRLRAGARMAQEGASQGCQFHHQCPCPHSHQHISSSHEETLEGFCRRAVGCPRPSPSLTSRGHLSDGRGLMGHQPAPREVGLRTSKSGGGGCLGKR